MNNEMNKWIQVFAYYIYLSFGYSNHIIDMVFCNISIFINYHKTVFKLIFGYEIS